MSEGQIVLRQTDAFRLWFERLRDRQARARVEARLARVRTGNFGDIVSVGDGVSELRLHHGPGYRIYFVRRGTMMVLLLVGGDKSSQQSDIKLAKRLAESWDEQDGAEDLPVEHRRLSKDA